MMPGFVDVTGWTSEQVRRLGHEDDSDEGPAQSRWRSQRSAATAQVGYLVTDVWAAASHAQRVNGAYVKQDEWELPAESATAVQLKRKSNRNVMMEALHNTFMITDEDRDAGEQCRKFIQNDLTFRALKNQLTDFDRSVMKIVAVTDKFYTVTHRLELATVACLPNSHARALKRMEEQARLNQTAGYIGAVGDKVTVNVEIVRCVFSQKWNTYYATGITANNETVFFAIREPLNTGTTLTLRGTVKAHRDGQTQLNRVSVQ
jgi:hypothetical protein